VDTRPGKSSLFRKYPRRGAWVVTMYLASLVLFVIAIFLPFTSVTKLWVFDNQVSVIRGLIILWHSDEIFLFLILFVFTVAFPFVKINTMLVLWLWPRLEAEQTRQMYRFVSHMGKWSMLDVFVVAILVLTLKSGSIASIKIEDGYFLFFVSVMLTQFATFRTNKAVAYLKP
jgi:paraquat-inducible protein A